MIRPSYRSHNVQDLDPGGKLSNPGGHAARARGMKFFSKIYEIPRAAAARVLCASFVPVKFTVCIVRKGGPVLGYNIIVVAKQY